MKKYLTLLFMLQMIAAGFAANTDKSCEPVREYRKDIECAYLIGSFNDWKLPNGDSLNGAKKLEYVPEDSFDEASVYEYEGALPNGDVFFMIYIPYEVDLSGGEHVGFYTSPYHQYPLFDSDRGSVGESGVTSFCEKDSGLDISRSCMIPDWTGDEVWFQFSIGTEGYYRGEGYILDVASRHCRPVPTPDKFYFIANVDGEESQLFDMHTTTCYVHPYGDITYWGYYWSKDFEVAATVSGYFSSEPSVDTDPSKCLGACGPDKLTLDPAEYGTGYKPLGESKGSLYLAPGKNPITISIIGGGDLSIHYLDILNWTVEFWSSKTPGSVEGITSNSSNQIVISGNTVTVPSQTQIEVYSLGGVKVRSGYGTRLDLGDLGAGTYIVRAAGLSRKVAL